MAERRLIETAFPLKQVSLDSVHEKNVRHGHISTLHIWPARRPLAASRAALLATLLPDPGEAGARRELLRRMAGQVIEVPDSTGETRETTDGGILHWGRERVDPAGRGAGPTAARLNGAPGDAVEFHPLARFRQEIKDAFGGRPPRVLDPFAGGGAIPLEAMRLGCEVVASDLNPVAWFILRCTLHYPHLLAGQERPLPGFALGDAGLMAGFFKARGVVGKRALREAVDAVGNSASGQPPSPAGNASLLPAMVETQADFAWHLRAWGRRVLGEARRALAGRYPTYAEFEPVAQARARVGVASAGKPYEPPPPKLLVPNASGNVSVDELNAEFHAFYLENGSNPRWVAKPTVAYLWARTVPCSGCRRDVPLLKTRWLCKKGGKRVLLTLTAGEDGAAFGVQSSVPVGDGTPAERRERDRALGAAPCPAVAPPARAAA